MTKLSPPGLVKQNDSEPLEGATAPLAVKPWNDPSLSLEERFAAYKVNIREKIELVADMEKRAGPGESEEIQNSPDTQRILRLGERLLEMTPDEFKRHYVPVRLHGHGGLVEDIGVFPDGRFVTASADTTLHVWRVSGGRWSSSVLTGHTDNVCACVVLADGRIASVSCDSTVRVWTESGAGVWSGSVIARPDPRNVLHCLQLLRDGSLVCCGAGNFALFVMTPQQSGGWKTEEIGEHPDGARTICALPDGSFVSAGQGDRILVWSRSETGEWRAQTIHSKGVFYVREIQPTSGGRFVSLGGDGKVRVWRQAASGTWEAEANQPLSAGAMCLKQLPDGGLVLGTADGAVEIWREEDGSGWTRESLRHEDPSAVSAIHVHQDGSIISAQVDGTVIRWHRREGLGWEAERMSDGKDAITRYVSLPDGTLVSTYVYSRSVLVWQLNLDEQGIVC